MIGTNNTKSYKNSNGRALCLSSRIPPFSPAPPTHPLPPPTLTRYRSLDTHTNFHVFVIYIPLSWEIDSTVSFSILASDFHSLEARPNMEISSSLACGKTFVIIKECFRTVLPFLCTTKLRFNLISSP